MLGATQDIQHLINTHFFTFLGLGRVGVKLPQRSDLALDDSKLGDQPLALLLLHPQDATYSRVFVT